MLLIVILRQVTEVPCQLKMGGGESAHVRIRIVLHMFISTILGQTDFLYHFYLITFARMLNVRLGPMRPRMQSLGCSVPRTLRSLDDASLG
jgi:hypothetical protein